MMRVAAFASLVLSIPLLLVSVFCSKNGRDKSFDFLTEFPFEHLNKENRLAVATRLTFFLSLTTSSLWLLFEFEYSNGSNTLGWMSTFIFIYYLISLATIFMISIMDPSNEKTHNFGFVAASATLLIAAGLEGFFFIKIANGVVEIIFAAICLVIALATLLLLVNPKLKNWPRLDSVAEIDGTVSYKRPRPFVMAASEWAIIALLYLLSTISTIGLIVISYI